MSTKKSRWVMITLEPKSLDGNPVLMIDGHVDTPEQRASLMKMLREELALGSKVDETTVCDGRTIAEISSGKGLKFAMKVLEN